MNSTGQLTLDVAPHPKLAEALARGELRILGELKIAGAFPVTEDLNHGDRLIITVADEDGSILARAHAEIGGPPPLKPIEDKDLGLLGYTRSHTAKLTEDALEGPA